MNITFYPWLIIPYKKIINSYNKNHLHHTIIVQSNNLQDTFKLIWAIIRWIVCTKRLKFKSCGICKGCTLILNKNHPDCYFLYPKTNKNFLEVELIRNTIKSLLNTAQQHGKKIFWIPNYSTLTTFGINALLSIIETPPKNTFFFIGHDVSKKIHLTFRSRCLIYHIVKPTEKIALQWIQKQINLTKQSYLVAIRISENNPILAKKILTSNIWNQRKELYHQIHLSIQNNNFIKLLSILNYNTIIKINWIILLLLDAMKFKKHLLILLINLDQKLLIEKIIQNYSYKYLNKITKSWIKCRYQLINIKNINYELLILKQLIKWEKKYKIL
ncbi:DNA polymerase III subunit delta' C-terminal domain-containing protein [Buchnera aphidicola]|uniref:DNA polymerase III subunit delta' C-terminal domain-containing protein n=1 Tax=Buchnera aphidicola TaxID=9 RepID=UPI00346416CC